MRIWLDPDKLKTYALTPADVSSALQAQNAQVSVGQLGGTPSVRRPAAQCDGHRARSHCNTPEQFGNIVLRSNTDGSTLRLRDVARVELGQANYSFDVKLQRQAGLRAWASTLRQRRQCAAHRAGNVRVR